MILLKSILAVTGIYLVGKLLTVVCGVPPSWIFFCGWSTAVLAVNVDRHVIGN